jgi:hypothetical protein
MKLRLELNIESPDENGNVFSESVIESIVGEAKDVPVFLEYDSRPLGSVTSARRDGNQIEMEARLDETRPETEFFEKGHIVYSVSCSYQDMDFEQTGDVRVIKSARLHSVIIEPGRKYTPESTIFIM